MGAACTCARPIKDKEVKLDTTRKTQLKLKFEKANNINYVTLIQAIYRGRKVRAKLRQKYKSKLFQTQSTTSNIFRYNSIGSLNINEIFEKYPIREEFKMVSLTLKPPFEFKNKREIYYGEWKDNPPQRHGRGVQQWLDGSRYEGYWLNDKVNIKGKLFHSDGDTYDGEWLNDKANGHGLYVHAGGEYYEGDWKDDKRDGKGKETFQDGSTYTGEYANGKRQGIGLFKWANGSEYEGGFFENMLHGKGKYTWNDKREYIGEWEYNQMNGYGMFKWPDGRKYEGEYKRDKKEGYGTFYWPDGRIYKGSWLNGKQHGEGEFYDPKEDCWKKGRWENGKKTMFYQ